MCGIFACVSVGRKLTQADIERLKVCSQRMRHRGPDERDYKVIEMDNGTDIMLGHERLMIIDLHTGKQPIKGCGKADCDNSYVVHNGEIYNHQQLRAQLTKQGHQMHTTCDSEVIVHLAEQLDSVDEIAQMCLQLDGDFAFAVVANGRFIAGRDPIGVKPLYYGRSTEGSWYFASEMKSIVDLCTAELYAFPPGHYYTLETGLQRYYEPIWLDAAKCNLDADLPKLRQALIDATEKRLMTDVPLGVLLSGGLDSSLTASIAARAIRRDPKKNIHSATLHSFTIALDENAPDAVAARAVALQLGTSHHEVHFTVEEGIAALNDIIYHVETYDVTTCRAGIPMYLLSKYIANMGVKVVLSGEGADEVLGGYLYFHNAPNDLEFTSETIRRVGLLSTADCQRADKAPMAHSLEVRVPFLDKAFLDVAMRIAGKHKRPQAHNNVEKAVLRQAFDQPEQPWLPSKVLWRQKEQFSDGVGYNWIDQIIAHCAQQVSESELLNAEKQYPINPPTTKEAVYIRRVFEQHFGSSDDVALTVRRWIPKWQLNTDPSGRASNMHIQAKPSSASLDLKISTAEEIESHSPTKILETQLQHELTLSPGRE